MGSSRNQREEMSDDLDLGRPNPLQLIFDRRVTKVTPGHLHTRVIQDGEDLSGT
jgi:hypothetical protein